MGAFFETVCFGRFTVPSKSQRSRKPPGFGAIASSAISKTGLYGRQQCFGILPADRAASDTCSFQNYIIFFNI
jgi:hypothetical protein